MPLKMSQIDVEAASEASGPLLLTDSISPLLYEGETKRGGAQSKVCPKQGWMQLVSKYGVVGYFPTSCKAWRCLACRNKVKALVVDRIEYGARLIPGVLVFITLTFKTGSSHRRDALSVERAYRGFLRPMRERFPNLQWFKTVEWTKRRQAHLHLIVGGVHRKVLSCVPTDKVRGKVLKVSCTRRPECLEHSISKIWLSSTKDSYIVSCGAVVGPKSIANYMSKYVTKEMLLWAQMSRAGFKRRWSCSQNWPRYERLELEGTREGTWASVSYLGQSSTHNLGEYPEPPKIGAFKRVGTDRAKYFDELKQLRKIRKAVHIVLGWQKPKDKRKDGNVNAGNYEKDKFAASGGQY